MASSSSMSSKGQVTIPIEIRNRLGLREGDRVEFAIEGTKTVIRPARGAKNPFERYIGALPHFHDREEINRWVASLRDDDVEER